MFPKGFNAGGIEAGISKKKAKKDIAVFYSQLPAQCAAMFTNNLVKAAPVALSRKHIEIVPHVRAIVANSGCANACTGKQGLRDAERMCEITADRWGVSTEEVLVASTGVIGQFLPMAKIDSGITGLIHAMRAKKGDPNAAAAAILTTDTKVKVAQAKISAGGKNVTIWGCAKGSGMIHPDLGFPHATMLAFILTDAAIELALLEEALAVAADNSFNCISVDGDTSTNDSVFILANGAAGNRLISRPGSDLAAFSVALQKVCLELSKKIVLDGEGATKLAEIEVRGAADDSDARKIASVIATSPLVKTALFGNDANWGRILAACGRAGVPFDPQNVSINIGGMTVAENGMAKKFSEKRAKRLLSKKEVHIVVDLHKGTGRGVYYTCDFSFDYVKINASYRS